jgi:hypothetical protein
MEKPLVNAIYVVDAQAAEDSNWFACNESVFRLLFETNFASLDISEVNVSRVRPPWKHSVQLSDCQREVDGWSCQYMGLRNPCDWLGLCTTILVEFCLQHVVDAACEDDQCPAE